MDRQCTATAKGSGQRCKRRPIIGGFVCKKHGGGAPQVQAKASERVRDMLADAIDPDCSMRETARLAYSDIRALFDDNGRLLPVKQWPEDIARAVAGVEVVKRNVYSDDGQTDDVIKVKLWDKGSRLENLMKHHGKLMDRLEITGDAELLARLDAGRRRNAERKTK